MNCGAFEENSDKSLRGYLKQLLQLEAADGRRVDSFDEIESIKLLNLGSLFFLHDSREDFPDF